eukprot:gene3597-4120_t
MSSNNNNNNNNTITTTTKPYEFYGANTTNPWKIHIFFEELGIEFNYHQLDIMKGDQFEAEFVKKFPNGKVPAIIDHSMSPPLAIFESGAILLYLAQKHGKFLPDFKTHPREHADVLQWLSWQISGLGPYNGQYTYFSLFSPEVVPFAEDRYLKETDRLYSVLDQHLADRTWIAGGEYSIADMAVWAWAIYIKYGFLPNHQKYTNVLRWLDTMAKRPAIAKILPEAIAPLDEEIAHFKAIGKKFPL